MPRKHDIHHNCSYIPAFPGKPSRLGPDTYMILTYPAEPRLYLNLVHRSASNAWSANHPPCKLLINTDSHAKDACDVARTGKKGHHSARRRLYDGNITNGAHITITAFGTSCNLPPIPHLSNAAGIGDVVSQRRMCFVSYAKVLSGGCGGVTIG